MSDPLPLVRDVDPQVLLSAPPPGGNLQRYVPRAVDSDLDAALQNHPVVMVVHESASGARRTVYEALLRTFPTLPLLWGRRTPDTAPADSVLWMDLTARHVTGIGWLAESLHRWVAPGRRAVVLVEAEDARLTELVSALEGLSPTIVDVDYRLTDTERATARELFGVDARTVDELTALAAREPAVPARHVAGYHPDTDDGDDQLGITADVHMLADIVVSRFVRPPLSIGLFSNWGTGKSFFMRHLRARVDELASAAEAEETRSGRRGTAVSSYCATVRQITFNAWHYTEANLWASLATHIFDNLATGGSDEVLRRRADDLAELRRHERSLLTQLSAVRLERMMVAARQERGPAPRLTGEDAAWVARELGVPAATTEDVRRFASELGRLGVEARRVWALVRRSRFALVMCGVGVVLAATLAFVVRTPVWPVVAGAVSFVVGVTPVVSRVREAAGRIRVAAESATAAADHRLAALDEETARLERAVAELASGHDATAFARSRHTSADYRQHLGVVSLLRRDLETFAAILAGESDVAGGLERIVLYVDDLDRCPPPVVVKVLEAIHLLVALPVFVVVVAVDPRWLHQAISQHYATLLPDESVTPAHYLEKILQVPFRLSAMDEQGFGNLVVSLASDDDEDDGRPVARPTTPSAEAPVARPVPARPSAPELRPRRLGITRDELDFLITLWPLVRTPRAAKRLVNLYRLVRARLSSGELDQFVRDGEYRAVLVLLVSPDDPAEVAGRLGVTLPADVVERWSPLARRFSFGHANGPR